MSKTNKVIIEMDGQEFDKLFHQKKCQQKKKIKSYKDKQVAVHLGEILQTLDINESSHKIHETLVHADLHQISRVKKLLLSVYQVIQNHSQQAGIARYDSVRFVDSLKSIIGSGRDFFDVFNIARLLLNHMGLIQIHSTGVSTSTVKGIVARAKIGSSISSELVRAKRKYSSHGDLSFKDSLAISKLLVYGKTTNISLKKADFIASLSGFDDRSQMVRRMQTLGILKSIKQKSRVSEYEVISPSDEQKFF